MNRYAEQLAAAEAALADHETQINAARATVTELGALNTALDADQTARFTAAETFYAANAAELDTLRTARDEVKAKFDNIERMTAGFLARIGTEGPQVQLRTATVDPFADLGAIVSRAMPTADVATRARTFVDKHTEDILNDIQRTKLEKDLKADRTGELARHLLGGSSPAYTEAFDIMFRSNGQGWHRLTDAHRNAMALAEATMRTVMESSDSAGGFLVPPIYDPTVIYTGDVSVNPMRQLVETKSISGPRSVQPTAGDIVAGYLDEGVEVNESLPVFGEIVHEVHKFGAYLTATHEALEDTSVANLFSGMLQRAKDEKEAIETLFGSGASGRILGLITALIAAGSPLVIKTASTGVFAVEDLGRLRGAVRPQDRTNLKWLGQDNTFLSIRDFAKAGNLGSSFWATLAADTPELLYGKPIYEASKLDTRASGDGSFTSGENILLAGNFHDAYRLVDRRGMTVEFDPMVKGANGRPNGKRGWFATWRTGGGPVDLNHLRMLQVK